jgi:hypothetical protein
MCIALQYSIPCISRKGRLKSLTKRLKKEATKEINKFPPPTEQDLISSTLVVNKFDKISGWSSKSKHIVTYVSALCAILEDRKYKKVQECLVDILDHFERVNPLPSACYWSGDIAKKKWDEAWN